MELFEKVELFNKPIIKESKYIFSNHKIFQKYSFELLETLCKKSNFENKSLILHKSIYFLLKFIYKSRNNVLIANYDIVILVSFYLGIKIVENQTKIPNLTKLKNIYEEKYGRYGNEEIKNAEILYIKLLGYKINFMTAYDYLCYILKDNKDLMNLSKNNLENLIKDNSYYFCTQKPISIVEECIKDAEKYKSLRCPTIIKRKIVQHNKVLRFDRVHHHIHHKDESLSTSISSGYLNYNNKNNDFNNERNSPLKNILSKYIENSVERLTEGNFNNKYILTSNNKYQDNITINNSHIDCSYNYTYSKKNINNKKSKNYTLKKDKKNKKKLMHKTSIKGKILQRNSNAVNKLSLNLNINYYTNDFNSNNSPKQFYLKPYFKKEESKGCFTSNKKKEKELNCNVYKKRITNSNIDDQFRCSLKKKILFDDTEQIDFMVE